MKNERRIVILLECDDKQLRQVVIPPLKLEALMECIKHENGNIRCLDKPIEGIEII